jgi:hypothetical protein
VGHKDSRWVVRAVWSKITLRHSESDGKVNGRCIVCMYVCMWVGMGKRKEINGKRGKDIA